MTKIGKIVEYIDGGRFICGVVDRASGKRLHIINQNGREVSLSEARLLVIAESNGQGGVSREERMATLQQADQRRSQLAETIALVELWELMCEEEVPHFSPGFLAEMVFGDQAGANETAALLRAVVRDRFYFKYKNGQVLVNSPEQVERLVAEQQREAEKAAWLATSVVGLQQIIAGEVVTAETWPARQSCLAMIEGYYLQGNEYPEWEQAKQLLKKAGLHKPHDGYDLLVQAGVWQPHENLALRRVEQPVDFTAEALEEAEAVIDPSGEMLLTDTRRADFRELEAMTIDAPSTRDYDDAIHFDITPERIRVGIHIADVTRVIKRRGALFATAEERGTSIYFADGRVSMLPEVLSEGVCSLVSGKDRATLSFIVDLDPTTGQILRSRITPAVICVKKRLSYEGVDAAIATDSQLAAYCQIGQLLRERRIEAEAVLLPFPDLQLDVSNPDEISLRVSPADTPSRVLVSELMILANSVAANYLVAQEAPGLFRSQPPPHRRLYTGYTDNLALVASQRRCLSRGELSTKPKSHAGLGLSAYTTITSPIRRFLDLAMQLQINNLVRGQGPCFSLEVCKRFGGQLSQSLSRAAGVSRQRQTYWVLRYLEKKVGETVSGLVVHQGGQRVTVLLQSCLQTVDLPPNQAYRVEPGDVIRVRIAKVSALDGVLRAEW